MSSLVDVKGLIKPDSPEYFHMASSAQFSCLPVGMISNYGSNSIDHDNSFDEGLGQTLAKARQYPEFLNEDGMKLFQEAQDLYDRGDIKDTLSNVRIRFERSGMWIANKDSVYFQPKEEAATILCSWKNITIIATRESDSENIQTSIVVFLTSEWCSTVSGSVYKLQM